MINKLKEIRKTIKNKMNVLLIVGLIVVSMSPLKAAISYDLSEFESSKLKSGLSYININDKMFAKMHLSPDLTIGPVGLGLDFNLYIPTDGGEVPSSLQSVTLRSLSYNHNDVLGIKWGRLQNVTYGYGLLMDNYDSGSFGNSEFNMNKAGLMGFVSYSPVRVDAMTTATNINAVRVSVTQDSSMILGSPIIIGATFIEDRDGVDELLGETKIERNKLDGVGVDLGLPIAGDFLTTYIEYARLGVKEEKGAGVSMGFKGTFFNQFDYRLEYRMLEKRFVPGYFNKLYETTSFDFSTDRESREIKGWYAASAVELLEGAVKAGVVYEGYDGRDPLLSGALGWKRFGNTVGVINYTMPFTGESNAIVNAKILYYTGGLFDYVAKIRRIYLTTTTFTEDYSMGVRLNLDNLFPKIPFIN